MNNSDIWEQEFLINTQRMLLWQYCVICAGLLFVKVKSGYHRDTDSIVTDFIIIDRATNREEHLHLGIDEETGEVLFEEWRKNH